MTSQLQASKTNAEELGKKNTELTKQYSDLKEDFQAANKRNQEMANSLKSLEQANGDMETKLSNLVKENESQAELNRSMKAESSKLKQKFQLMADQNEELTVQHEKAIKQNKNLVSQIAMLTSKKENLSANSLITGSPATNPDPRLDVKKPVDQLKADPGVIETEHGNLKLMNVPEGNTTNPDAESSSGGTGLDGTEGAAAGFQSSKRSYGVTSLLFLLLTAAVGLFVFFTLILERKSA